MTPTTASSCTARQFADAQEHCCITSTSPHAEISLDEGSWASCQKTTLFMKICRNYGGLTYLAMILGMALRQFPTAFTSSSIWSTCAPFSLLCIGGELVCINVLRSACNARKRHQCRDLSGNEFTGEMPTFVIDKDKPFFKKIKHMCVSAV